MRPQRAADSPHQPVRRVALPSSPAGTLRLREPCADTDGARCSVKCHNPAAPRPGSHGAWERHYVFNDAFWYLRRVSNLEAEREFEITDPTAAALYWNASPEVRMRDCTPDHEFMSHPLVDASPQRRERQLADFLARPVSRAAALAALRACRHSIGQGLHR